MIVDWASAGAALATPSGDLAIVARHAGGVLVAVIDGLGHGPEAARAARAAGDILEAHAGAPVVELVERCHAGLRKLRGAVMSLATFDAGAPSMTWLGVGNVAGELRRAARPAQLRHEALLGRGGVVGYQLPPLRAMTHPVAVGDLLILASDGIRGGFAAAVELDHSPQAIADTIFAGYAKGSDDSLVVVARYRGLGP